MRPFKEKDRESIRDICRQTGQKGNPARIFFEDEEIIPMLYADYYIDYEPESCFVAEVDGKVVGYTIGCKDTRRYIYVMWTRILPRLCLRILWKILTLQYREIQTYRTLWWIITRGWRETMSLQLDDYPAHAHSNVETRYRGHNLGLRLSMSLHTHLREQDVKGIHGLILEEEGDNSFSTYLCQKRGYRLVAVKRLTLWEKVTGKKGYLKLLVCDLRQGTEGSLDASFKH